MLLALGILAMTVGLIRGEAAGDLRTLTAAGATSTTRRNLTATTAGALALLGVLLGAIGAYLALIAGYHNDLGALSRVPVGHLAVTLVGLPVAAAAAGWLLAGREPPAIARQPLECHSSGEAGDLCRGRPVLADSLAVLRHAIRRSGPTTGPPPSCCPWGIPRFPATVPRRPACPEEGVPAAPVAAVLAGGWGSQGSPPAQKVCGCRRRWPSELVRSIDGFPRRVAGRRGTRPIGRTRVARPHDR